jgi:phosphoglycerate dehydrogenase-like enzyme
VLLYDVQTRRGNWAIRDSNSLVSLAGKTVLIVGFGQRSHSHFPNTPSNHCSKRRKPLILQPEEGAAKMTRPIPAGRIGTRVAKRCAAFEMNIIVADPALPRRAVEGLGYEYCADFREALPRADVVTLHMPAAAAPVLGVAELAAMKDSAILVNCARGALVDEAALLAALERGDIGGVGLDVLQTEPPPPETALFAFPTDDLARPPVVISPHCSPSTAETAIDVSMATCENALRMLDGHAVQEDFLCPDLPPAWVGRTAAELLVAAPATAD